MYEITAKPIAYAGITFRSRLEAHWAAFFDTVGIPWEYEPVRLPGWIPDFRLFGRFLVEVKPIVLTGFAAAFEPWVQKAVRDEKAILLGDRPRGCLGCLVSASGGLVAARTVFFDPHAPFKMRSVPDAGKGHPLRGSAEFPWRVAAHRIRNHDRRSLRNRA